MRCACEVIVRNGGLSYLRCAFINGAINYPPKPVDLPAEGTC
jgi:hypothetical protein